LRTIQTKSIYIGVAAGAGIAAIFVVLVISSANLVTSNGSSNIPTNHLATAAAINTSGLTPTNRTFWIDTIHLDGSANIYGDNKHPPEPFPANATYPSGGGFVLTAPDKTGAWNFRSFTFSTSQIAVYQGDKVTLNFVGVQGTSHYIEVQGVTSFALTRGQIHTVIFTADKVGTIDYFCHVHMPNMHGEILVMPRPSA
jgi:plastocyanin